MFFLPKAKKHSIPAKAGISSRVSGNFREAEWSPVGECGYRRRDSCLRRNGIKKEKPPPFGSGFLLQGELRIHSSFRMRIVSASPYSSA